MAGCEFKKKKKGRKPHNARNWQDQGVQMERQGKRDKAKKKKRKKEGKEKVGLGPPGGDSDKAKVRSIMMYRVEFKSNSRTVSWKKAPVTGFNAVTLQVSKSAALYTPILPIPQSPYQTPRPLCPYPYP